MSCKRSVLNSEFTVEIIFFMTMYIICDISQRIYALTITCSTDMFLKFKEAIFFYKMSFLRERFLLII